MRAHWFLPDTPDVLATLRHQVDITLQGMAAFAAWANGDAGKESDVRSAEHAADVVRRELSRQLRSAFSTPIDQEDLYTLSERLDAVLNTAKNVTREAEALDLPPDAELAQLADLALAGAHHLDAALQALATDPDRATAEADAAIAVERQMEKRYRAAMRDILRTEDLRLVVERRELYRRMLEVGEREAAVAERVWYAVVKES